MSGRSSKWWWLLLVVAVAAAGCRWPDSTIVKKQNLGTVYDTAHEKLLDSDKSLPLLEAAWRDDIPVYAEPVAIRAMRDGVSTWEIFFATNRDAEITPGAARALRYGVEPLDVPQYGRADVTLPRRRRGVDPRRAPDADSPASDGADVAGDIATVTTLERLPPEDFLAGVAAQVERSRQQDVLVFMHGFNVGFEAALVRTAQIALDLPFNGAVVAYSWPSLAEVSRYRDDETQNAQSIVPFRTFLTELRGGLPEEAKIHIVVHSMGNRIVLEALAGLPPPDGTPPVDNLCLFAPDVGLGQFHAQVPAVVAQCRRVTLYASRHDGALIISKGLHAEQRAGDAHPPVVVPGVETVDCSAIDGTSFLGHSYYSSNVDVLADLFQVLKRDRAAANRIYLKAKKGRDGRYWRWAGTAPRDIWIWHFDDMAQPDADRRLQKVASDAAL